MKISLKPGWLLIETISNVYFIPNYDFKNRTFVLLFEKKYRVKWLVQSLLISQAFESLFVVIHGIASRNFSSSLCWSSTMLTSSCFDETCMYTFILDHTYNNLDLLVILPPSHNTWHCWPYYVCQCIILSINIFNNILEKIMKYWNFENTHRDKPNDILYDIIYLCILIEKYSQSKLGQNCTFLNESSTARRSEK